MENEKKSVLGSITGTFKSELKNNVLDKLGPNLGTSIEKALEAKAAGKNFSDTFSSEYKSRLAESWKDKIFGQGIIGKSLRAGFEAKFGPTEKADPNEPVLGSTFNNFNDDLSSNLDNEQGVLLRLETLATNISENLFNITAAWSKNAKTLEETRKLQEDQHKLEMMAAEEAALETKAQTEPLTKPTPTDKENAKPGLGLAGITGMFSGLLKTVSKFKSSLFNILKSKKFLALAALTIGTGAAAAVLANAGEQPDLSENAPVPQANKPEPTAPTPTPSPINLPQITEQDKEDTKSETQKLAKLASAREQSKQNIPSMEQATPVSKSSTTVTNVTNNLQAVASNQPEVQKLNEYFLKPENVADKIKVEELSQKEQEVKKAIEDTKDLASNTFDRSEKARYEYVIKNQLEPSLKVITNQKQEIIDRAQQSLKLQSPTMEAKGQSPSLMPPPPTPAMESTGKSGASFEGGAEGDNVAATMLENKPVSGLNINMGSEAVESASMSPKSPKIVNVDNSSSSTSSNANKSRRPIMSPVANRGSLDNMSFFRG